MRKVLLVAFLALNVSGCTYFQTAFDFATTPVTVTPAMAYDVENGLKIATTGLVAYGRLCLQKVIDPVTRNCRHVIEAIQPYTRAAGTALIDLRAALRANDQATALTAYASIQKLLTSIQAERQKAGGI